MTPSLDQLSRIYLVTEAGKTRSYCGKVILRRCAGEEDFDAFQMCFLSALELHLPAEYPPSEIASIDALLVQLNRKIYQYQAGDAFELLVLADFLEERGHHRTAARLRNTQSFYFGTLRRKRQVDLDRVLETRRKRAWERRMIQRQENWEAFLPHIESSAPSGCTSV